MDLSDLYSENILAIAANQPVPGRLPSPDASARRVSRVCGSSIEVDIVLRNWGDRRLWPRYFGLRAGADLGGDRRDPRGRQQRRGDAAAAGADVCHAESRWHAAGGAGPTCASSSRCAITARATPRRCSSSTPWSTRSTSSRGRRRPCRSRGGPDGAGLAPLLVLVDWPFRVAAYVLIQGYRYSLSMFMGRNCRHAPSCSEFTLTRSGGMVSGPAGGWASPASTAAAPTAPTVSTRCRKRCRRKPAGIGRGAMDGGGRFLLAGDGEALVDDALLCCRPPPGADPPPEHNPRPPADEAEDVDTGGSNSSRVHQDLFGREVVRKQGRRRPIRTHPADRASPPASAWQVRSDRRPAPSGSSKIGAVIGDRLNLRNARHGEEYRHRYGDRRGQQDDGLHRSTVPSAHGRRRR